MYKEIVIDDHFVLKLKKRDIEAFHQLYCAFELPMKLVCMRYLKVEADAEDVFQEGFLKVYDHIHQLKKTSMLVGWMKRIFINSSLDFLKQKQKNPGVSINSYSNIDNGYFEESIDFEDELTFEGRAEEIDYDLIKKVDFSEEELLEALAKIPDHFRVVFQLYVIDKIKHKEIAKLLDIKEKTSKTRLLRARQLIKKQMQLMAVDKLING